MKILKVFLLTFVISFTVGNINAQGPALGDIDPCSYLPSFYMDFTPLGDGCVEVTVTSDSPVYIFIQYGDCIEESAMETTHHSATFCVDSKFCPISETTGGSVYIECGLFSGEYAPSCREGCYVVIEP